MLRLSAVSAFAHSLQKLASDEHKMWQEIEHSPLGEIAVTSRLEYINDICEGWYSSIATAAHSRITFTIFILSLDTMVLVVVDGCKNRL